MEVKWSDEIPFDTEVIEREVPVGSGVYQIVQSVPYPRHQGHTRILKGEEIGLGSRAYNLVSVDS